MRILKVSVQMTSTFFNALNLPNILPYRYNGFAINVINTLDIIVPIIIPGRPI